MNKPGKTTWAVTEDRIEKGTILKSLGIGIIFKPESGPAIYCDYQRVFESEEAAQNAQIKLLGKPHGILRGKPVEVIIKQDND